jgi:phosphoribosyl-AMP cyclohydrolase
VVNKDKKMKKKILSIVALVIIFISLLPIGEVFALVKDFVETNTINVSAPKQPDMVKNTASVTMTKKIPVLKVLGIMEYRDLTITSMTNGDILCTFGDTHFTMKSATNPVTEVYSLNDKSKTSVSTNGIWTDLDNTKYTNKTLVEFRGTATSNTQKVSFIPKAGKQTWVEGKTFYVGDKDSKTGKPKGDIIGFNWDDAKQTATFDNSKGELNFNVVSGQPFLIDPSVVATDTRYYIGGLYGNDRQIAYTLGRHWVFYQVSGSGIYWKTSTDGISWSAATQFISDGDAETFDTFFDGTYIHYVRDDWFATDDIFYRRGLLNADGTITWSAAEQTALVGSASIDTIAVDSGGHVWIGYQESNLSKVIRNDNVDGTWATTAGFPYTLHGYVNWGSPAAPKIAPLTAEKVYIIYSESMASTKVHGILYNAGWGAEDTIRDNKVNGFPYESVTADGDVVEYVYVDNASSAAIRSMTYNAGWGAASNVVITAGSPNPRVAKTSGSDLVVFWSISSHVWYKYRISGVWGASVDWINEADTIPDGFYGSTSFSMHDNVIGYIYPSMAGSPYDINYAFLTPTVAPSVTTQAASSVTGSTARLNGYVDSDGGEEVVATFSWDVHTHSCNMTAYANTANVTGTFATGETPYYDISTLSCNTTYYYCMRGSNSLGQDSGGELTFTTSACVAGTSGYAPSTLVGVATDTTISLNWISANATAFNLVRYGMGCGTTCTVTSNTTGTMSYNGTLTYNTISGLTAGTAYCFYVFGNGYSSANATLCLSTLPSAATTNTIPTAPQPTGWFQAPDYTTQALNPLYTPLNVIGNYLGMPLANFWMFIAMMFSIAGSIIALIIFKNLWVAAIVLLMLIVMGWTQKLIPLAVLVPVCIAVFLTIYYSFRGRTA